MNINYSILCNHQASLINLLDHSTSQTVATRLLELLYLFRGGGGGFMLCIHIILTAVLVEKTKVDCITLIVYNTFVA